MVFLHGWMTPVLAKGSELEKIVDIVLEATILFGKGAKVEKLVGELSSAQLESQMSITDDSVLNARARNILNRLMQNPRAQKKGLNYQIKVLNSSDVNAYALPGGFLYVTTALLRTPGVSDDEITYVLGHELGHTNEAHGIKQLKSGILASLIGGKLVKGRKTQHWAAIATQLFLAGRSRKDEKEADRLGFEYAVASGADPSGGLTFMRRLETLSKGKKDPFQQLFATHPPTEERSEVLKSLMLKEVLGWDFKFDKAFAAETDFIDGPFSIEEGLQQYQQKTGRKVYHYPNYYDKHGWTGQCTWFVFAVREKELPTPGQGDAYQWYDVCQQAGYEVGTSPKPGAIAVWTKDVPGSEDHGHVAMVTAVDQDGSFDIWESNWSTLKITHRKLFEPQNFRGFVYWKGTANPPDQPQQPVEPTQPYRRSIQLLRGPIYLGDDRINEKTVWFRKFRLYQSDLESATQARVTLRVKGTPRKDPTVFFNRQEVGRAVTVTGQWEQFEFTFNPNILHEGENLLDLETFIPNMWQSYDDCEIANMWLNFN